MNNSHCCLYNKEKVICLAGAVGGAKENEALGEGRHTSQPTGFGALPCAH